MSKRAVLFANGELLHPALLSKMLSDDDFILAVDGGANHVISIGRIPDLLMGDLDSVDSSILQRLSQQAVEIKRFPVDKDETDLELALLEAVNRGYYKITIVCALGERIDHQLANLYLLLLPQLEGVEVSIDDGIEEIFLIKESSILHGNPGDVVSLIPIKAEAVGVLTSRLKYPLNRETLYLERSRGISNVMLESTAEVSLDSGTLLCIHIRKEMK